MLKTDFKFGEVIDLSRLFVTDDAKVAFRHIVSTDTGGVSLLTFKRGQGLDPHVAPANVMVCVVKGEIEFIVQDKPHTIRTGEFMLLGQDVTHSVLAKEESHVMLIKIKEL